MDLSIVLIVSIVLLLVCVVILCTTFFNRNNLRITASVFSVSTVGVIISAIQSVGKIRADYCYLALLSGSVVVASLVKISHEKIGVR